MVLLRTLLGDALRRHRQAQRRTLREVSGRARISLGYLSEVERGRKEASSELLEAICGALAVPMSSVLSEVAGGMAAVERVTAGRAPALPPAEAAGVEVPTLAPVPDPAAEAAAGMAPAGPVPARAPARKRATADSRVSAAA